MKQKNKKNLGSRVLVYMGIFFLSVFGVMTVKMPVMAAPANIVADTSTDASWITEGETNEDIDEVTDKVKKYGRSAYKFMETVLVIVAIICGIAAAICLIAIRNGNVRMENKLWIVWILAGVAVGSSVVAIINFFANLA